MSRKTSWGMPKPPPSSLKDTMSEFHKNAFDDVDLSPDSGASTDTGSNTQWNTLDNITALGLSFNADDTQDRSTPIRERFSLEDSEPVGHRSLPLASDQPFNKWLKNLQRRATQRRKTVSCDVDCSTLEREILESPEKRNKHSHKKSLSGSSFGFVTAVKSASISLASISVAPRSRKTGASSRYHRTDRSSKASHVGRLSEDSSYIAKSAAIDQAVTNRLLQRRRVLEEIVTTEESYVADIRFLMNVCEPNIMLAK